MRNRPLVLGIAYSILVIIFKLIIILGGYGLSKFGFYFSHIVSVVAIAPFIFFTIQLTKADNGGFIGGKEALKTGLKMLVVAAIITSAYNYIEFEWKWKDLSIEYYNSQTFKDILATKPKFTPAEYPKIISEAISGLSAFKAITGKLFILFFFSISVAFISAVFLRKGK
jgi:hypothetical protein